MGGLVMGIFGVFRWVDGIGIYIKVFRLFVFLLVAKVGGNSKHACSRGQIEQAYLKIWGDPPQKVVSKAEQQKPATEIRASALHFRIRNLSTPSAAPSPSAPPPSQTDRHS